MDINDNQGQSDLLEICAWLHNLQVWCVGINQVLNIYVPTWQTEDGDPLAGFLNMLFETFKDKIKYLTFMA